MHDACQLKCQNLQNKTAILVYCSDSDRQGGQAGRRQAASRHYGMPDSKSHLEFDAAWKRVTSYRRICSVQFQTKCLHSVKGQAPSTQLTLLDNVTGTLHAQRGATVWPPEIGLSRCGNRLADDWQKRHWRAVKVISAVTKYIQRHIRVTTLH